ncbi:hypothetical protein F5Y19DRAFT_481739 [Xylariaceae sp. FL1651]|nr:hypothetical protein F5Y19DRAFT_481739 [Xylariaceae sp. FL1651]
MRASFEGIMMNYAFSLIERLDLNRDGIVELIKILEASENAAYRFRDAIVLPFDMLVEVLPSPENPMPEYLSTDEAALDVYTEAEMDLIVLQVEARAPRNHRHSPRESRSLDGIHSNDWVMTLPVYTPDIFPVYDTLKQKYFPHGIDDAIPGFMKHYLTLREAIHELKARCARLEDHKGAFGGCCKLASACHDLVASLEPSLDESPKLARMWFEHTATQLKLAQLPGANFGLEYGSNVYVGYFNNSVNDLIPARPWGLQGEDGSEAPGKLDWRMADSCFNPIRMRPTRPGSPWCDWFRNRQAPDRCQSAVSVGLKADDEERHDGSVEIHLPHAVLGIMQCFRASFRNARHKLRLTGELPTKKLSKKEREKQAQEISDATGQPYWRLQRYKVSEGSINLMYSDNLALTYRPIYDGAGNLRLDYMNTILHEITHTQEPFGYRRFFKTVTLTTPDTDDKDNAPTTPDSEDEDDTLTDSDN